MIRPVTRADAAVWCTMRTALWPEGPAEEHAMEIERFFWSTSDPVACLVAETADGIVGFVELAIRGYAEGCGEDRVGYLEGWYVAPEWRRRGIGRALVAAGEAWARAQGCRAFASDTPLANTASQAAHRALGFIEAERIVCYCKPLLADHPRDSPSPH